MTNPSYVVLKNAEDTSINSVFPTLNIGSGIQFIVSGVANGLVKFDISSIPSNATISQAIFSLFTASASGSSVQNVHRLVRNWVESEATWNEAETGTNWGTAGAANTTTDYNSTLLDTITQSSSSNTESTADITSTVQDWVDGTSSNYGLRLSYASGTAVNWHSADGLTAAYHPSLAITYTLPLLAYEVNSTAIDAGIKAEWKVISTGKNSNATQKLSTNWREHIWSAKSMNMTEYLILAGVRGTSLTELKTTDESNLNTVAAYSTAKCLTVTGNHRGVVVENVKATFLVDITS